jgi:hypothetical protein
MNLSEEVSKGLELFGDSAKHFTDDSFKQLAQLAFDILLKKKTEDDSLTSDGAAPHFTLIGEIAPHQRQFSL